MKNPDPSTEARAGKAVGKIQIGKSEDTKERPASSTVSNIIPFPGARPERSHDAREAWRAMAAAITARDAHIVAGGGISDPEYKRLASVAVMARGRFEASYLGPVCQGGAA